MPPTVIRRRRSENGSIIEKRIDRNEQPQHPYERPDLGLAVIAEEWRYNRKVVASPEYQAQKAMDTLNNLFSENGTYQKSSYMTPKEARQELERLFSKKTYND